MDLLARNLIILLKFLIPVAMLISPFSAIWANYFLDIIDGDLLMWLGLHDFTYQTIDKAADFVSYCFILLVGLRWRIRKTIIILFLYRAIGQILFFITRKEIVFFYFENFLEPLAIIYVTLIAFHKSEEKAYTMYKKHKLLIWSIILLYKMWNEWYLHFANIDLSTMIFGLNGGA